MSVLKYHRIIHLHNDVVDGDVNKLHEKPDEAHNCESYRCGHGDLLELCEENIQRHCQFERKNKTFLPIHSDHHIVFVPQWILLQAGLPFLSGLVHLFTRRMESLTNILLGSTNCIIWSILVVIFQGFLDER